MPNFKLSSEQITFYREQGYLLVRDVFDEKTVASVRAVVEALCGQEDLAAIAELEPNDNTKARRIWAPSSRHELLKSMSEDSRVLDKVEGLLGENILFHHSKLNLKAPKVGTAVDWHQDFSYYPHTNTDLVACLVHLDRADEDNGCLNVMPAVHQQGVYDHYIDNHYGGKITSDTRDFFNKKKQAVVADPGDVLFIHPLCPHQSNANFSGRYRRVLITSYRAADAFPIYFAPHAAHNEAKVRVLRGQASQYARVEAMKVQLPYPKKPFGSIYKLQQGEEDLSTGRGAKGYYSLKAD